MPKKNKEGRSWGLVFSLLLHGSIILLVLVWGIKKYTADTTQPINVSLSSLEYRGSSDKAGDGPKSTKAEKPQKKPEEPKKEGKPEVKEEPKEEVVKKEEPKEEPKKEEPKEEEVVKKEEPKKEEPKEEIVEKPKEEPKKKEVALEEKKKEEPKKEAKKEPKKEPKKEKKKEVAKKKEKPKEKKDDAKTAREDVINELKRKSVIDDLNKSDKTTKTASVKESPGLKGNDNKDVAGSTGKVNTALLSVYKNAIFRKIEPKFKIPPNIPKDGSLSSDVFFKINNSGDVSGVKIAKSSGNPAFDNFCINTIISSSPLPAPPSDISKLVVKEGFQITLRNDQ